MNSEEGRKRRIAFMIGSLDSGGAERVISVLANNFVSDWKVKIIPIYKDVVKYNLRDKVEYSPIRISDDKKGIIRNIERIKAIRKSIGNFKPDIIISFLTTVNIFTLLAVRKMRIPVIVSERSVPDCEVQSKGLQIIRNYLYKNIEDCHFVFQTEYVQSLFGEKIKNRSRVIFNPLKDNLPGPFNGKRDKRIVCVARLEETKNIQMLLRAFQYFLKEKPDYILELYGEGVLCEKLSRLAESLNIGNNVIFKGFTRTIHSDILSAQMFVLPSNFEGISNAMIEALAIGIPVICTDCPAYGARLFIEDGVNGYLIPVGDEKMLLNRMKILSSHPEIADKFTNNAVKIREQLDSEIIANQWKDYMGEIIENCNS